LSKLFAYTQFRNCVSDGFEVFYAEGNKLFRTNKRVPSGPELQLGVGQLRRIPIACSEGLYIWGNEGSPFVVFCAGPHDYNGCRNVLFRGELLPRQVPEYDFQKIREGLMAPVPEKYDVALLVPKAR
jgi:hypothetical protein